MSETLLFGPVALEHPDEVLATRGRTFHWAKGLLKARHAADATRLYGFCRAIDDLADEMDCVDESRRSLATVRRSIVSGEAFNPAIADMVSLMCERGIQSEIVCELIDGIASDLETVRIPDIDALTRYCYRVAGTVGLMMCRILDVDSDAAAPHAIDLGIAMQLTNICRDVAEDAAANRRYLPATLVGDIEPNHLVAPAGSIETRARRAVGTLLDLADRYYESGERGLAYLPVRARGSILVAARLYRAIGGVLRRRRYAYWTSRAAIPSHVKAPITLHALLMEASKPSFWRPPRDHNAKLHAAIAGLPGASLGARECDDV